MLRYKRNCWWARSLTTRNTNNGQSAYLLQREFVGDGRFACFCHLYLSVSNLELKFSIDGSIPAPCPRRLNAVGGEFNFLFGDFVSALVADAGSDCSVWIIGISNLNGEPVHGNSQCCI